MLNGKVAVVTGGSSGIGEAVAVALAGQGAKVAVVASHAADKATRVADAIRGAGGEARGFAADVRDPAAVERLFAAVDDAWGGLDVLVNAAGVYYPTPVEGTQAADVDRMVDARRVHRLGRRVRREHRIRRAEQPAARRIELQLYRRQLTHSGQLDARP